MKKFLLFFLVFASLFLLGCTFFDGYLEEYVSKGEVDCGVVELTEDNASDIFSDDVVRVCLENLADNCTPGKGKYVIILDDFSLEFEVFISSEENNFCSLLAVTSVEGELLNSVECKIDLDSGLTFDDIDFERSPFCEEITNEEVLQKLEERFGN